MKRLKNKINSITNNKSGLIIQVKLQNLCPVQKLNKVVFGDVPVLHILCKKLSYDNVKFAYAEICIYI